MSIFRVKTCHSFQTKTGNQNKDISKSKSSFRIVSFLEFQARKYNKLENTGCYPEISRRISSLRLGLLLLCVQCSVASSTLYILIGCTRHLLAGRNTRCILCYIASKLQSTILNVVSKKNVILF